ncbi:MAG: MFS transporter [Ilumatobacteraceae bacterium]
MTTTKSTRLPGAYWRLVTAHGLSNIGDGVFLVALPLLALRLTRDPLAIAMISAAAVAPWLLLSLPVGAIIDRSDRRRIMVWANVVRAVALAVLCLVIAFDSAQIWMLWIVALVLGCAEVFYDNSSQALVPDIVPSHLLEKANGRMYSVEFSTNTFIGTPLGSIMFAAAVALPFGIDAASFMIATVLILTIPGSFRHEVVARHKTDSLYAEVRTGMRWLWRDPLLRTIAISLGLSNLAFQMPQAVFVLFASEELSVSERGYGFLFAIMGIGAVLGGLLGDRIVARVGQSAAIYGALVTWIITLLAVGFYPVTWWVTLAVAIESMAAAV